MIGHCFQPGDVIKPDGGSLGIYTSEIEGTDNDRTIDRMEQGHNALVLSVGKEMLFILFNGVIGYVYVSRITKVF